jgi:hypothetical protein
MGGRGRGRCGCWSGSNLFTGKTTLTDYNFETPNVSLPGSTGQGQRGGFRLSRRIQHEGRRIAVIAAIRLEERESVQFVVNGASRCRAFRHRGTPSHWDKHYRKDTNGDYF